MKSPVTALLLLPLLALAAAAAPTPRMDADGPAQGTVVLELEELWRAGGEDGEILFGRITDVDRGPDGEIYVLDNQLCQVEVFGPDGGHRRTLSRQGDGPGEVRQPIGTVLLPDGLVGIGAGFPGQLVLLRADGTPVATRHPIGEAAEGNIGVMISLGAGGGLLAATGGRLVFETPETSYTERFLAVGDADGDAFTRILQRRTPIDPTGRTWDERADYYFDGRWALDARGRIYVPMERDRYVVSVFDRHGELLAAFGRELEPRRRTDADKDRATPVINVRGERNADHWDICDTDPAIARIMIDPDDGLVWVLSPHGATDQPDGVLETWDVFTPEGEFLRRVAIPLGHRMREGTCHLVGGGLLVVVRGTGTAFNADAEAEEGAEEPEPLEVICFRIAGRS